MDGAAAPLAFGQRLQALLDELQHTQAWLAEQTQLERSTISRLIKGERNPTPDTVACIAPVLGLSVAQLVLGTDAASRIRDANDFVPRADHDAAVRTIIEYERQLGDLKMKLNDQTRSLGWEEERRKEAHQRLEVAHQHLSIAHHERERLQRDLDEARDRNQRLDADVKRHREALYRAVAEICTLRGRLKAIADELKSNTTSSRLGMLLAGVAALASVVTVATFLGGEDKAEDPGGSEEPPTSKKRTRKATRSRQ